MKKLLFYLNIISILFIMGRELITYNGNRSTLILFLIVYLILIILPDLVNSSLIRVAILLLSTLILLNFPQDKIVIFIPFHIIRSLTSIKGRRFYYLLSLTLIPLFIINSEDIFEYIFTTTLLITLVIVIRGIEKRKLVLNNLIEKLEVDNRDLTRTIIRNRDFEVEKEYQLKLEERSKIAQKLHDELGHTISGSIFQLEAVKILLESDISRAGKMIDSVSDVLNSGINSIRDSLKVIKPSRQDIGLQNIKRLLAEFEAKSGIKAESKTSGDTSLITNKMWSVIHCNLKEALTNVLKYSGANNLHFSIDIYNKIIKVLIKDDGVGSKLVKPNMGLSGMEERMSELSGTLIVDGSKGFSVTMLFYKE